jgi:uncharacterized membrane protein
MISTCILINYCILKDFKPPVDVSIEDVNCVQEMLCEYILKETIDRKGNFYGGAPWVYCGQKLELIQSSLVRCRCLRNLLGLAWLGIDTAWFRRFTHDSIQTSHDESNLKLYVILACLQMWSCLSINVILLFLYLWCENVFVMSPCYVGYHTLAGSRMQPLMVAESWLVPGCRRQLGRLL